MSTTDSILLTDKLVLENLNSYSVTLLGLAFVIRSTYLRYTYYMFGRALYKKKKIQSFS